MGQITMSNRKAYLGVSAVELELELGGVRSEFIIVGATENTAKIYNNGTHKNC